MITEVYNDKKLINISRNQNDGSSKSFNGDGLVNLFLFTFNAFLYGRKTKVLQDLEFNINTISDSASAFDDEIKEIVSNMEKEVADYNASQKNNFFRVIFFHFSGFYINYVETFFYAKNYLLKIKK